MHVCGLDQTDITFISKKETNKQTKKSQVRVELHACGKQTSAEDGIVFLQVIYQFDICLSHKDAIIKA